MNSDPFHPDADLQDGTAAIHPITPEMLNEAGHRAAQLADGVAHHTIAHAEAHAGPAEAPTAAAPHAAPDPVADASDAVADAASRAEDMVGDAVAATEAVLAEVSGSAMQSVEDAAARTEDAVVAMEDAAAQATDAVSSTAADTLGQYNAAVFGMIRSGMAATGELFAALVQAKSVPEAVAINADHLRRQFDAMTVQGRELATLTQKLTLDALKPFGGGVAKDR